MNPYEELGLPADATDQEIKAAYRAKSKKHHPDVGGDADKFSKVSESFQILISSERRSHYDSYGSDKPEAGNKVHTIIYDMITNLYTYYDISGLDIKQECINTVQTKIADLEAEYDSKLYKIRALENSLKRVKSNLRMKGDGVNFFEVVLEDKIKTIKKELNSLEMDKSLLGEVLEYLDKFECTIMED